MQNNGQDPFSSAVADLRAFLTEQEREEERLRRELLAVQDGKRRAMRAIDVLTDRKAKTEQTRSTPEWTPRPETLEKVLEGLRAGADTAPEIARRMVMAQETVHRSLRLLRSQQRVRATGRKQAGNSPTKVATFALMPEDSDAT